jgi:hypothetical protein
MVSVALLGGVDPGLVLPDDEPPHAESATAKIAAVAAVL